MEIGSTIRLPYQFSHLNASERNVSFLSDGYHIFEAGFYKI